MLEVTDRYYSVREVALRLGVSKRRVYQLLQSRRVATRKIANVLLIPEKEILRLEREERRPGRPKSN